jgi:hypothetical protein
LISAKNQFAESDVICGEVLTFTCTVGGGNTVIWSGSAFDCAGNEITLVHEEFNNGTSGECNNGAIIGWSVGTTDTCYYNISKLNVTGSNGLNNKIVKCSSDSGNQMYIGESSISMAGK